MQVPLQRTQSQGPQQLNKTYKNLCSYMKELFGWLNLITIYIQPQNIWTLKATVCLQLVYLKKMLGKIWTNPAIGLFWPSGWVKHLTQLLVENNPIAGFVHILLSAGLYLTQHFFRECKFQNHSDGALTSNKPNGFWFPPGSSPNIYSTCNCDHGPQNQS